MKLESIELENYRCFHRLRLTFRSGFNVIAGVNGSGKTTILKSVRDALIGFTAYASVPGANLSGLSDPYVARIQPNVAGDRYRFEEQYPVKVTAAGEAFGQACQWVVSRDSQAGPLNWTGQLPGQRWQAVQQASEHTGKQQASEVALPVLAYYPAYRRWDPVRPDEMAAATERPSRFDGYRLWWDAASDSAALQRWGIAKSMERLQFATEKSSGWDGIQDDELAMANVALAAVLEGAKGLRYDFTQKSLLIEWNNGAAPTAFQNLSDGQRVAVALVVDLARRMCLLNPHLGQEVTRKTPGVVLIDELDIHLHPKWQRLITKGLRAAFPLVQFIAASHSPQVLGELQPEEIILLRPDGIGHPQVSYGLDASRVLEQIMDAGPRSARVEEELLTLFESIERNELTNARKLLASLKALAPGIPELAGAEALLKRKEVIGR